MVYKKILIAVDGSPTSDAALHEAIKLAKNQQAKLRIVHVVNEFIPASDGVFIDFEKYEAIFRAAGQAILKKAESIAKDASLAPETGLIEIVEYDDHISEKIVEEAKKWHADLVIIGTHGRRGLRRFILGSVAEGVTRITPIPVLLIHGKE